MAMIIRGKSCCTLCDEIINEDDALFSTSGVFIQPESPLSVYCDSGMHWDCYAKWKQREEFAVLYFRHLRNSLSRNGNFCYIHSDDDIYITAPAKLVFGNAKDYEKRITLLIAKVGLRMEVESDSWDRLVANGFAGWEFNHSLEEEIFKGEILPKLQAQFFAIDELLTKAGVMAMRSSR